MWQAAADVYFAELDSIAPVNVPPPARKNTKAYWDWQYASRQRVQVTENRADRLSRWNTAAGDWAGSLGSLTRAGGLPTERFPVGIAVGILSRTR